MQRCNGLLRLCWHWSISQVHPHSCFFFFSVFKQHINAWSRKVLPANKVSGDIIETFLKAHTWAPLFQPLDSIRGGSHILIKLECWKLWNVEIVDISMSVPKERRDFLRPRPTLSIKSGIWDLNSVTDPWKPNCWRKTRNPATAPSSC